MPTWRPDPTFYPSPRSAMHAPAETLAYVVRVNPTGDGLSPYGLITLGGASLGLLLAVGGAALGAGVSVGGVAAGSIAIGGVAIGILQAIGGAAFGPGGR